MTYLLDTNSCIQHLRHGAASPVSMRLLQANPGEVVICSIVMAELCYGAHRSAQVARNLAQIRSFCAGFVSLPFDDPYAAEYAEIRAHLDRIGQPIGPNDLMIASIARAHGLTLITNNTSEFSRVPGISVEDWQTP